ncbi:MAG: hypothetical protein Q4D41_04635 [Prevotellaceae bacterium]|nr:hypothetical protein [Prevotellaceae bacterium]
MNKNIKQIETIKNRSYTACVSESFRIMSGNIKTIFFHTWLYALILSLAIAFYASFITQLTFKGYDMALSIGVLVSVIVMICAEVLYYARTMTLLNHQTFKKNNIRCAKIMCLYIGFSILIGIIYSILAFILLGDKPTISLDDPMLLVFPAISLVIMLVTLPYIYVFMKYLSEPETKLRKLVLRAYKIGFRHWGFIFAALFLAGLCAAVCGTIVSIPLLIVLSANTISVIGVRYLADPIGLPSYFPVLQFFVYFLTSFVYMYINIFILFTCNLIYGSIEAKEKERKEFLLNKQQ